MARTQHEANEHHLRRIAEKDPVCPMHPKLETDVVSHGKSLTVLLTLGRLPKALELARALAAAGCRVLVADPFAFHLCRASNAVAKSFKTPSPHSCQEHYLSCLLDIVVREDVDLILPVSEEALHVSLLKNRLPDRTRLFALPNEDLQALHDKYIFIQIAEKAGLKVPETRLASDAQAPRLAGSCDTVLKPRLGCSGQELRMLSPDSLAKEVPGNSETIIQKRIFGREVSTLSLCRDGEVLAHVTYEGLVFAGTVSVCFQRVDDLQQVKRWVADFAKSCRYSYFLAFDFIVDEDGTPWPLECNPRLTSGIHFLCPEDIADAITNFEGATEVGTKPGERFQEAHTTLLQVYGNIFRPQKALRHLRAMLSARDVLWSLADPAPFPLMTPYSWPVLKQVMFRGRTFGEAATRDIAWPPQRTDRSEASSPAVKPVSAHGSCS
ncbi:MAG: ATP-grasp domain-containing protein [Roseibium sp.]|uniref:ATP-grasp domain-containing protein n=1 Tax=Roseibium sp. TaxID=1936156 RepID=UPI001B2BC5B5|nr:ATP-grasp domain-containing protein [Roseibium sp.]MBO6895173.1 ATP-grasp domain-containing protein [Roseibium sp.]MBO6930547.1 ATP-grasp domain-containing protein [Roseibium sp.]